MDSVNMSSLLLAEEDKIRTELKADSAIDQNRRQSVDRLNDQAAAVRDMLGLLLAGTARKEIEKRRFRVGGVICLLLAVIFGLIAALLIRDYYPAGCILMAAAVLFGFLAGRLWYGEREVRVHAELDADVVWKTLKKAMETMDRKSEEYLAQEETWVREQKDTASPASASRDPETLRLLGDLLEALYADNGDYALRQLKKLLPWLRQQGIEAVDYSPETADLFELLPTKRSSATQRPALVSGETLLLAGRATEHVD